MAEQFGEIIQVIGPVVDVSFERSGGELPRIHDALEIIREGGEVLIIECQQHIGENSIRAIAMDATDGLKRGMKVHALDGAIRVPVGEQIRGRLLNVIGNPIDGIGPLSKEGGYEIHSQPPKFENLT